MPTRTGKGGSILLDNAIRSIGLHHRYQGIAAGSDERACQNAEQTEAPHWPISALDPSMILFNAVVKILAVPVADIRTKLALNRTGVTVMPVGGHPGRSDASHRFRRSKELLCRGHIAGLAQHHVHQRASAVNRPVQIAPSAIDFDVGASGAGQLEPRGFCHPSRQGWLAGPTPDELLSATGGERCNAVRRVWRGGPSRSRGLGRISRRRDRRQERGRPHGQDADDQCGQMHRLP
jgi:hypothetical protein